MSNINLLPWRQQLKAKQQRHFILQLSVVCLLSLALILLAHRYIKQAVWDQQQHNKALQAASTQLDNSLITIEQLRKRQQLLQTKVEVIEQLQQQRHRSVQLFNQLADWVPAQVYLERVHLSDKKLVISGKVQTHDSLGDMVKQIERSRWLGEPKLSVSAADEQMSGLAHQFLLQVSVKQH